MTCGLVIEELEILNVLRTHFSFSKNKSFDPNHIAKAYLDRFKKNPVDIADQLRKKRIYYVIVQKRWKVLYFQSRSDLLCSRRT